MEKNTSEKKRSNKKNYERFHLMLSQMFFPMPELVGKKKNLIVGYDKGCYPFRVNTVPVRILEDHHKFLVAEVLERPIDEHLRWGKDHTTPYRVTISKVKLFFHEVKLADL